MFYLLISILLFAINNVLWSVFAKKDTALRVISKRAIFTSFFLSLLLWLSITQFNSVFPSGFVLELLGVSCVGFLGLIFLVEGFKYGTMLQYCTYSLLLTFIFFIIEHFNTINSSVYKILPLVCIAIGFIYFIKTQFTNKFNKTNSRLSHVYFGSAHVCFGLLVYFQSLFLKRISAISIAFTQELTVLLLAHGLLLLKGLKLGGDGGDGGEAPSLWQYALFAIPISLAVLIGLLGLKTTSLIDASLIGLLTPVASIGLSVLCGVENWNPKATLGFIIMVVGFLIYYV